MAESKHKPLTGKEKRAAEKFVDGDVRIVELANKRKVK